MAMMLAMVPEGHIAESGGIKGFFHGPVVLAVAMVLRAEDIQVIIVLHALLKRGEEWRRLRRRMWKGVSSLRIF